MTRTGWRGSAGPAAEHLRDPELAVDRDEADAHLLHPPVQDVGPVRRGRHEGMVQVQDAVAHADVLGDVVPAAQGRERGGVEQQPLAGHGAGVGSRGGHQVRAGVQGPQPVVGPGGVDLLDHPLRAGGGGAGRCSAHQGGGADQGDGQQGHQGSTNRAIQHARSFGRE